MKKRNLQLTVLVLTGKIRPPLTNPRLPLQKRVSAGVVFQPASLPRKQLVKLNQLPSHHLPSQKLANQR